MRPTYSAAAAAGSEGSKRVADRLASGQQWLDSHVAPGVGKEFMPPLDEGTLMFMPVTSNAMNACGLANLNARTTPVS